VVTYCGENIVPQPHGNVTAAAKTWHLIMATAIILAYLNGWYCRMAKRRPSNAAIVACGSNPVAKHYPKQRRNPPVEPHGMVS